jgi:hypothetical protein
MNNIELFKSEILLENEKVLLLPFDIPTKKEGNELAPIALQFLFNPTPNQEALQNCMAIPCGIIVFFILLVLNPGSDS